MTELEIRKLFGYNLRKIRKEKGISQMQLAEKTELGFTFISDIENGKKWVSSDTISKFSIILETEPYKFFLPQGFDLKKDVNVVSFVSELNAAIKTIQSRYLV